jgi:hypothetical protein
VRIYWFEQSPLYRIPLTGGGLFDMPYWLSTVLERISFTFQKYENARMKELKAKQKREATVNEQIKQLMGFVGEQASIR